MSSIPHAFPRLSDHRSKIFHFVFSQVLNLAASYDGMLLAWGTDEGKICLISTETAEKLAMWQAHNGPVADLHFSPCSKKLFSVGEDIHAHAVRSRACYCAVRAFVRVCTWIPVCAFLLCGMAP